MTDLPSPRPPQRWEHGGKTYYFGPGELPPGTERGSLVDYQRFYREQVAIFEAKIAAAQANVEREREQRAAAPQPLPAAFDHAPAPLPPEGSPSPFTPGATIRYSSTLQAPTTMHDERQPRRSRAPSYELIIQENQSEAVQMALRIFRISPDRGDLGDVDLFENLGELNTLGLVRTFLEKHHYDGRPAIFQLQLVIDGEADGPWQITLPKDQERIERAEIDRQVRLRKYKQERGLIDEPQALAGPPPPPAAPPPPPAPMPTPQGGFFTREQAAELIALALEEQERRKAPPAPPPAPAPPAPQLYTPEEVRKMIAEELEKAKPPAPTEPEKSALDRVKEELSKAKETIETVQEMTGAKPAEGAEEGDDPTVQKNGLEIPRGLFKTDPKTALLLSNSPVVMGFLGGIKDAAKELIHETAKVKKDELANRAEELRQQEKEVALQAKKLELLERAKRLNQAESASEEEPQPIEAEPVVTSGNWAPPRHRRTAQHGSS